MKKKKTKFFIVSRKPYHGYKYVKLCTYNFEIATDYTYLGKILTITNELPYILESNPH